MKNEKDIEPDELDICDECGYEYDVKEIKRCRVCKMMLCRSCMDLHDDQHYFEAIERLEK